MTENNNTITIDADNMPQTTTLETSCASYVRAKTSISIMEEDLKSHKDNHEAKKDLDSHWRMVKKLRMDINNNPDILDLKQRIKTAQETMKLQGAIIAQFLKEQQLSFFKFEEGSFVLKNDLRYKKFRRGRKKKR